MIFELVDWNHLKWSGLMIIGAIIVTVIIRIWGEILIKTGLLRRKK